METVTHDGRETAYHRVDFDGDGATVLYVHGSGGDHRDWEFQYDPPEPQGAVGAAVAVDLSGHGASDDVETDPGSETLAAYTDDVVAVARETDATVVAGNSMGGGIVLQLLLERDLPLDAVALVGSGAKLAVREDLREFDDADYDDVVELFYEPGMLFHDPESEAAEGTREIMYDSGPAMLKRDLRTCNEFDVRDRLGELSTPMLAITGDSDGLTPPWYHEHVADNVDSAEQETIANAAHFSMIERSEQFNEAVDAFLQSR